MSSMVHEVFKTNKFTLILEEPKIFPQSALERDNSATITRAFSERLV